MGEVGGFLRITRVNGPKRPIDERVNDFKEYQQVLPVEDLRDQGARCMECGVPFCHSGCPLGNLIPDWNDLVFRDDWKGATGALHATNNFPEFTGRVCPAPCEAACVLDINDDPVTIKQIEMSIADRAWEEGWEKPKPPPVRSGHKVAVIGSGPAGMAAAQELNYFGHEVTLYERNDKIGGLLQYGIPDFKLEKWIVARRVQQMADEGVEIVTGVSIPEDLSVAELRERFHAVVIATGSTVPRDLPVPGRELDGIHFAMDYLEQRNRFVAGEEIPNAITARDKHVVIIGGGDTGADCLGNSHREQPKSVRQFELLGEPPPERPDHLTPWPRWPMILRTSAAHEEGGERRFGVMTTSFEGKGGVVIRLHGHEVGPPPSFDKVDGTEFSFDADLVLLAMGFLHPQHDLLDALAVDKDERGNVACDDYASSVPGVFAAGDARRGQSLVVWAIAEGRQCARQVDQYLHALDEPHGDEDVVGAVLAG